MGERSQQRRQTNKRTQITLVFFCTLSLNLGTLLLFPFLNSSLPALAQNPATKDRKAEADQKEKLPVETHYSLLKNLGWTRFQQGDYSIAASYLKQAIESVQSPGDLEEWSLAMFGLGEIYEATQNLQQALLWYSQAKTGFVFLDDQRAEVLNRRIEKLKKMPGSVLIPRT